MLQRRIEEASLNGWPALQQMLFDGWILRFSRGYTKRANSVNPVYASSMGVREKIETCETLYTEKGLCPIFRITPFAPADLDRVLEDRRYKKIDLTLVLHLDLRDCESPLASSELLRSESLDGWMAIFCGLTSSSLDVHQTHKEILLAIPSRRYLASLVVSGQAVSCGMGVLEGDFFGLFDVVTDSVHRGKGYGARLVSSILGWAREQGAVHVYLQVVEDNAPARRLYAGLGFQEAYRYWYRVSGDR